MEKLRFYILATLAFVAPVLSAAEGPNSIVIMVDDMGSGGVSCFENQNFKTPEIDR